MKKRIVGGDKLTLLVAFSIIIIGGAFLPRYLTYGNIMNIIRQSVPIAICSMATAMIIIGKEIDLAIGGLMACCAMISGLLMTKGIPFGLAIIAGCLFGLFVGVCNGALISKIKIPSFIATYVTGQIAGGVALILCQGQSISGFPEGYKAIGNSEFLHVPILTYILVAFTVVMVLIMEKTRVGKHIYALGGNEAALRLEGVNVDRVKIFSFAVSGVCAGTAGILLSSIMNTVNPTQGSTYQLDSVAAAVIGGVSMLGGEGSVWAAVAGALLIGFLRNMLTFMNLHPFYQNLAIGVIILVIVGMSVYNKGKVMEAAKTF